MKVSQKITAGAFALLAATTLAACSSSKPSQDEVKAGFMKAIGTMAPGAAGDVAQKIVDCAVPKFYDQVSADTLNVIAKGDTAGQGDAGDANKITDAVQSCTSEAMSAVTGSVPTS